VDSSVATPAPIAGASFASVPAALPGLQASAPIPFRQTTADDAGGSSLAGALALCAVALAVLVLALRRRAGRAWPARGQRLVEVVESARLADSMRVSVIRYRGRELLVAHSEHAIAVLDGSSQPGPPEMPT